jgi:hypothetical protein
MNHSLDRFLIIILLGYSVLGKKVGKYSKWYRVRVRWRTSICRKAVYNKFSRDLQVTLHSYSSETCFCFSEFQNSIWSVPCVFSSLLYRLNSLASASSFIHSFIHSTLVLQPFVGPWPLLHYRKLSYTDCRTPWTSDQPLRKTVTSIQDNANTE